MAARGITSSRFDGVLAEVPLGRATSPPPVPAGTRRSLSRPRRYGGSQRPARLDASVPPRPDAITAARKSALDLVKLPPLMQRTAGNAEIVIGLIDGPVACDHPEFDVAGIELLPGRLGSCSPCSFACAHGTFMAGILAARRGSGAPAICPECRLLLRPIFRDPDDPDLPPPSATLDELTAAIHEIIDAGARIINLSAAFTGASASPQEHIQNALDICQRRGVIVVVATGNQTQVGGTILTRHPWVIPVVAYDAHGTLLGISNLGGSIGRRGLGAPGEGVTSLAPPSGIALGGGTSVAAPFVTGAIALLWSEFPKATASEVWLAVTQSAGSVRRSVVPPLLDAEAAYRLLATHRTG